MGTDQVSFWMNTSLWILLPPSFTQAETQQTLPLGRQGRPHKNRSTLGREAKMVTQANVAHLCTRPHQNYNWTTQQPLSRTVKNWDEWKFYKYETEAETASRLAGGAVSEWAGSHRHSAVGQHWEGHLRSQGPQCQEGKSP